MPGADTPGVDTDAWRRRGRYVAGLPVLALMGVNAFVRGVRVPLLGWIDLAIHEAGHVLAFPLPDLGMAAMGSGLQVLVPLLFAAVFWLRERDVLGTALCLGWAGTSLQDASLYIADAPFQRLPLIGGEHDWAWVLGPRGIDQLAWADELARVAWLAGLASWVAGAALCVAGPRLARALAAGHRHRAPWALWSVADDVPSRRVTNPDLPPAAPVGRAAVAVPTADGAAGPVDPADARPGAAGGVDTRRSGDAPRAHLRW